MWDCPFNRFSGLGNDDGGGKGDGKRKGFGKGKGKGKRPKGKGKGKGKKKSSSFGKGKGKRYYAEDDGWYEGSWTGFTLCVDSSDQFAGLGQSAASALTQMTSSSASVPPVTSSVRPSHGLRLMQRNSMMMSQGGSHLKIEEIP